MVNTLRKNEVMINDEFVATMPTSMHAVDLWYDIETPYMTVSKSDKKGSLPLYACILSNQEMRAMGRRTIKIRLGHFVTVEAARAACVKMKEAARASVKAEHVASYHALLEDRDETGVSDYRVLSRVLWDAYNRAAAPDSKGEERHGNGLPFEEQPMQKIMNDVGIGFALGQAMKKLAEGRKLGKERARAEFLDAIVYIAGAVVWIDGGGHPLKGKN